MRQFWAALGLGSTPVEEAVLSGCGLNAAQIELFRRLPAAEQRHAVAVLRTLEERGQVEPALAQAALLHDVGKAGGRIRLWHRVATVCLQAVWPAMLQRLALDEPASWRYPFYVQVHHAERGAALAAEAGTDAVAVALIRAHHATPPRGGALADERTGLDAHTQALLTALCSADERE